jgi:hypothetical protein
MGQLLGGQSDPNLVVDADIQNIRELLLKIQQLDQNNDGIITKSEFTTWQTEQKIRMTELEEKITSQIENKYSGLLSEKNTQILNLQTKVDELTKQMGSLKNMNGILEAKLLHEASKDPLEQKKIQQLSKDKINEFVTELLSDQSINSNYLPDFVEKKIYKNVFNLLIGLLDKSLSTTSIKFLGHTMTFSVVPDASISDLENKSETNPKKKKKEREIDLDQNDEDKQVIKED